MNNFEKQLPAVGQTVSMTIQEKRRMRAALERVVRTMPVKKENLQRSENRWSNNIFILLLRNPMPIALILTLVVGGGVSFAAEGTLPGDLLYPVKVSVNEEIKETFTFSPEAKAQWESERAERRLAEAVSLSAEGKLSVENEQKIAEQFEKHAQKVAERIKEFEERDPELASEVTSQFETSIDAHAEILARLSLRNSSVEDDSMGRIIAVVRENRRLADSAPRAALINLQTSAKLNEDSFALSFDSDVSEKTINVADVREFSVLRMLKLAESKANNVSKIIQKFEISFSTSTMIQVKADFATMTQEISDGKSFFEDKAYNEAFSKFQDAFNLAHRLEILLKAEQKHRLQIFPAIIPISEERDDDDDDVATTSRVNVYLQKEANRMKEKADEALTEARLKLSEEILRSIDIMNKVQGLITEAQEVSIKAETAYVNEDYTSALRLWNISYANATAARGLLSRPFQSDDDRKTRRSGDSHDWETEIKTKVKTEDETEDLRVKTKDD